MTDDNQSGSDGNSSNDKRELSKSKNKGKEELSGGKPRANSKTKEAKSEGWSPDDGAGYIPTEERESGRDTSSAKSSGNGDSSSSDE